MSLLERARSAKAAQSAESIRLQEMWDNQTAPEVACHLNYQFKFDPPVEPGDLTKMSTGWERTLWGVEREGLAFICGKFWHGNPGDAWYVGVRKGRLKRVKEWPPRPNGGFPVSQHSTTWAPRGYVPCWNLARLAEIAG